MQQGQGGSGQVQKGALLATPLADFDVVQAGRALVRRKLKALDQLGEASRDAWSIRPERQVGRIMERGNRWSDHGTLERTRYGSAVDFQWA